MTTTMARPPFDQNDRKYTCLCGTLHIRKGARIVAVLVVAATVLNVIFSLTRSSTVALGALMNVAFCVVVFGSLIFGVFKEKRLYLMPYLIFQAISLAMSVLVLFIFIIAIAVGSAMVVQLAQNLGNVDINVTQAEFDAALATFTVLLVLAMCFTIFVQSYFLETIYHFHIFLRDRESSFAFNFEAGTSFQQPTFFAADVNVPQPPPQNHENKAME